MNLYLSSAAAIKTVFRLGLTITLSFIRKGSFCSLALYENSFQIIVIDTKGSPKKTNILSGHVRYDLERIIMHVIIAVFIPDKMRFS